MKAYIVRETYGDGCCVEFADHNVVARRNGANELNTDFGGVECNRYPAFDEYAPCVPDAVLVEHGWWFECMQCGQRISSDLEDEDGEPIELEPIYAGNHVFCPPTCQEKFKAERLYKAARAEMAVTMATQRWPGIEIRHKSGHDVGRVEFSFPGGEGRVTWSIDKTTVLVERRDVDAWHQFEGTIIANRLAEQHTAGDKP